LVSRRKQLLQIQDTARQLAATVEKKLVDHEAYFEKVSCFVCFSLKLNNYAQIRKRDALRLKINQLEEERDAQMRKLKTGNSPFIS
jgi:hypothetical protein